MNILATDKFIDYTLVLMKKRELDNVTLLDLSQILSAAKHLGITSAESENGKKFWDEALIMSQEVLIRDAFRINKKTFIVILNSLSPELARRGS
jgi:hypothetical protein